MKPQTKYGVAASAASTLLCEDVRNFTTRRRNLLYLMHRYLLENGFYSSAEALKGEARLSDEFELCDNVDLDAIYLEYASFFNLKFGKYPRILKKQAPKLKLELGATKTAGKTAVVAPNTSAALEAPPGEALACWHAGIGAATAAAAASLSSGGGGGEQQQQQQPAQSRPALHIRKMETAEAATTAATTTTTMTTMTTTSSVEALLHIEHGHAADDALFASLEWQALAELVKTSILSEELRLRWSDVCGNQRAVELVKEAVLTLLVHPQLFAHGLKPWRSLLLHGPPGSGKTHLAKALYAETRDRVTFFNITASIMISKWRGESEKILRVLFHTAARRAPSIIFFDEIESLTSRRDRATDHESSKRFKNELLQLLDGMEHSLSGVFVLASTNLPWDIDDAFLRRFEKKLLVQLPSAAERASLIGRLLGPGLAAPLLERLVCASEHFTGDEIRLGCKEISMQRMRCAAAAAAARSCGPAQQHKETTPAATLEAGLERAFSQIRPLGAKLLAKHEQWQQENGS
ncbi:hypothetical protein KR093_008352 [Drosophila rubida]|uniref:AAA+ ATPase domain-containing protein n=1 Tax=Drosophila rubida TaxID=30044 RepID=A0AAD4KBT4_9MUSC|nr:hypothetical protein KR093_008352 [Drosophila rubida]